MKEIPLTTVPPWTPCECCDDYICNVHNRHVSECDCPSIDEWADTGWSPYDTKITNDMLTWMSKTVFNYHD